MLAKEGRTLAQLGASAQSLNDYQRSKGKVKDSQAKARAALLDQLNVWRTENSLGKPLKQVPAAQMEAGCPIGVRNWPIKEGLFYSHQIVA